VDTFVSNLKNDMSIREVFSRVEMVSLERRTIGEYTVTYFTVKLNP
jgi:hypothetical protein